MISAFNRIFKLKNFVLGFLVLTTLWIFLGSFSLNKDASKMFPQITSGFVLILLFVYFTWQFLPQKYKNRLPEHEALTYGEDAEADEDRNQTDVAFTFISMGGLIIGAHILGLIIAIPAYLYVNLWYFNYGNRRQKLIAIGFVLLITIIAYVVLSIPIDQGMLLYLRPIFV